MLTKLRGALKPLTTKVGTALSRAGVTPNELTVTGLLLALLTPLTSYVGLKWGTLLLFICSCLMDYLDGAVAKASGRSSKEGAFLDSFSDRVSDAAFTSALLFFGFPPWLVIYLITASFLISYARARGEALGLRLEGVGLMERGERLIALGAMMVLIGVNLPFIAFWAGVATAVLDTITVLQRAHHIYVGLRNAFT
ncbi:MAG: CDP-alcohol phosphatidyltransferase family protein [Desulfurococcales archaeon]|nr:CDP-alcohol phosphatidyltransferase family protein [Desulfurococcales archaeon]